MIDKDKWIVGTFEKLGNFGYVTPDDSKEDREIMVLRDDSKDAKTGDKVTVRVLPAYPEGKEGRVGVYGEILEVLGPTGKSEVQMLGILRKHYLSENFPPDVLKAAEAAPRALRQEALEDRRDLTGLPMVTIDDADARDLDDAVSLESLEAGKVRLGVHIADVGWYVKEGSVLDLEALARGVSVYFPDQVLPMLPPEISNDLCSLNAGVPRLAMSCIMDVDEQGKLLHYEILPTLIQVTQRLTYDQVQDLLDQGAGFAENVQIRDMILKTAEICRILRENRFKRGALDFDLPECKIIMDQSGKPADILHRPHRPAEALIEEMMILANETVAAHFQKLHIPFIYRVHEEPGPESVVKLNAVLSAFGLSVKVDKKGKVRSVTYQKLLNLIQGRSEAQTVHALLLRSMNRARYDAENTGHFGLASQEYCHFTSPIRRYADLAIHRVIRETGMEGKMSPERKRALEKQMRQFAEQASEREKAAETAERDAESFRKAEYMTAFVGKEFEGVISNVTGFGFYVRLPNTVEGLVHVNQLDGYYIFNEKRLRLENERKKISFNIGDEVHIRLTGADPQTGFIEFNWLPPQGMAQNQNQNKNSGERRRGGAGRGRGAKNAQTDANGAQTAEAPEEDVRIKEDTGIKDVRMNKKQAEEKKMKDTPLKAVQTKDAQPPSRSPAKKKTGKGLPGAARLPQIASDERDHLEELQEFKYTAKTLADWINPDKYNVLQAPVRRPESRSIRLPEPKSGSKPIRLPETKTANKPPKPAPDIKDGAQLKQRQQQKNRQAGVKRTRSEKAK
jgi:ribonuclease R